MESSKTYRLCKNKKTITTFQTCRGEDILVSLCKALNVPFLDIIHKNGNYSLIVSCLESVVYAPGVYDIHRGWRDGDDFLWQEHLRFNMVFVEEKLYWGKFLKF